MTDTSSRGTITELLRAVEQGDREAFDALFPLVYDELRLLARRGCLAFVDERICARDCRRATA